MSVGGISTSIPLSSVKYAQGGDAISTKLLSKALDDQESAGQGLQKMMDSAAMERSVNPHIGGNFDLSV